VNESISIYHNRRFVSSPAHQLLLQLFISHSLLLSGSEQSTNTEKPRRRMTIITMARNRNYHVCCLVLVVMILAVAPTRTTCLQVQTQTVMASPVHALLLCRHGDSIWNGGCPGQVERFTGWTVRCCCVSGMMLACTVRVTVLCCRLQREE
jgi:hypothetical protein